MNEMLLSVDEFMQCKTLTGVDALLKVFINLLVIKPGTYPDSPTMGINLKKYLFMDVQSATFKLISSINKQVDTFLPDMNIFECKLIQSSNKTVMGLYITFGHGDSDYSLVLQSNENNEMKYNLSSLIKNKED